MPRMSRTRRRTRGAPRAVLVVAVALLGCLGGAGAGALLFQRGALPAPAGLPALFAPTATPTPTLPPTLTPSPTPLPSPTPTPTPVPPARVEAADRAMFAGDWARAVEEYSAVLGQTDEAELRAAAQLGLGRARLSDNDPAGAIAELTTYLEQFPDTPAVADAQFLLGEAYALSGQWAEAQAAYAQYLALRPGAIDSYAQAAVAEAALQQGDYPAAAAALQAAVAAPRQGDDFDLRERLAETYAALGNVEAALAEYDGVFQATNQNWRRARLDVAAGQLLYGQGRYDEAYARFLHAVNNYPSAAATFDGLLALVNDGVPVDDLQRGLVNYFADNHEAAQAAFDRYRAAFAAGDESTSAAGDGTALYYLGLSYAATGQEAQAIAAWRELLDTYPASERWTDAYFQIAFLQPYPDDAQTFQAFAAAVPNAPEAPDALFRAARLSERNGDLADAAELWTRIAREYPQAAQAADAANQAGIVLFRTGDLTTAARRFEQATTLGDDAEQHARAWLWLGKVRQQQRDPAGARQAFEQAAGYGPHGYYPLRAAQLLRGEAPFTPPARFSRTFDAAGERQQVEQWLRATFPAAQGLTQISELQPGIWREPRFVRGQELWRLGRLVEAHAEFDSLRRDLSGDPLATWQLALYFNQLGAYDLGIRAARQVIDLAGYPDPLLAPRYLLRLRYPMPFAEHVLPAASQYAVHPFVMYAKMRIESFFWKYAFSSAEARGLNQVIPPTADDLARRMGLAGFEYDDLYRPAVSIPMGAYYLHDIETRTGGGPAAALAGYYAGPGNAQIWLDLAEGDPDLFVEVIRLPDAKGYVQTTFEYFEEYKELYGK